MSERDLPMRFLFEGSHSTFDRADFRAFFDPEFPAAVGGTLHFPQGPVLARSVAVFLGSRVFRSPLFHFVEK